MSYGLSQRVHSLYEKGLVFVNAVPHVLLVRATAAMRSMDEVVRGVFPSTYRIDWSPRSAPRFKMGAGSRS